MTIDYDEKGLDDLLAESRTPNPSAWQGKQMPALQSKFLDEFLLTATQEREYGTMKAWAEAHGLNSKTVGSWKKDRRFRAEWGRRADAKNLSTERIQAVMDTIYDAAANGDVAAAKLYLSEVQKMRPPTIVEAERDLADMSDDELDELLAELAGEDEGA